MKKQWLVISGMVVLFTMLLAACNNQPATEGTNLSVTDTQSILLNSEQTISEQSANSAKQSEQSRPRVSVESIVARSKIKSNNYSKTQSQKNSRTSLQITTSSPKSQAVNNDSYAWSTLSTWSNNEWKLGTMRSVTLIVGERKTVTARVYPPYKYENQQIKAEISDPTIIKVTKEFKDNSMEIEGLAVGECYVHFTAPNGLKSSTRVRVIDLPSSSPRPIQSDQ